MDIETCYEVGKLIFQQEALDTCMGIFLCGAGLCVIFVVVVVEAHSMY